MGIGPAPATRRVLHQTGLTLKDMDIIELNEAFASQGLAVLRDLGIPEDADFVNPNGGAIALGHRSEEHTSELQSLMRISYAVFCLKQKKTKTVIYSQKFLITK